MKSNTIFQNFLVSECKISKFSNTLQAFICKIDTIFDIHQCECLKFLLDTRI